MYTWSTYKSPIYVTEDQTKIDCIITFTNPDIGEVPFTASLDDVEEHGRTIYQMIVDNANNIPIAEYVNPSPTS